MKTQLCCAQHQQVPDSAHFWETARPRSGDVLREERVKFNEVDGRTYTADLFEKYLTGNGMTRHMSTLGFRLTDYH